MTAEFKACHNVYYTASLHFNEAKNISYGIIKLRLKSQNKLNTSKMLCKTLLKYHKEIRNKTQHKTQMHTVHQK